MKIIKVLRKKNKETQTDLSRVIGVSLRTIQNWEAGFNDVPFLKLKLIAQHYSVSISYLFGEHIVIPEDEKEKSPFEVEIQKIVDSRIHDTQKEIQDLNKKLDEVSSALSELILEREEKKILKGIKNA
jgi:transcriptional regulator with XRE-family HTH domain